MNAYNESNNQLMEGNILRSTRYLKRNLGSI